MFHNTGRHAILFETAEDKEEHVKFDDEHNLCDLCGQDFIDTDDRDDHRREKHATGSGTLCKYCLILFTNLTELSKHIGKCHPETHKYSSQKFVLDLKSLCELPKPHQVPAKSRPTAPFEPILIDQVLGKGAGRSYEPSLDKPHETESASLYYATSLTGSSQLTKEESSGHEVSLRREGNSISTQTDLSTKSFAALKIEGKNLSDEIHASEFPWDFCDASFEKPTRLDLHCALAHATCNLCDIEIGNVDLAWCHLANNHPKCPVCDIIAKNGESLESHKAVYHPICELCKTDCRSLSELQQHERRGHVCCEPCSILFASMKGFLVHERNTHWHPCKACNIFCRSSFDLVAHEKKNHHSCSICSEVFDDIAALSDHQKLSHICCAYCRYAADRDEDVQIHAKITHSVCRSCVKVFKDESDRWEHEKVNHITCRLCKVSFRTSQLLADHRASQHVTCGLCRYIGKDIWEKKKVCRKL